MHQQADETAQQPGVLRMGDWARARIRSSLSPYGPSVHAAVGSLRGRRPWEMQPPWEQGSLGGVLGSGSFFKPLVMPLDCAPSVRSDHGDQPKRPPVRLSKEPWKAAVVHSKAWADLEDDKRASILEVWKLLILTSANGTKVGENLASMQSSGATDLEIAQCLRDTFASKSTATLRARSSSLAHFARWKASVGLHPAVFPLLEPDAYRYACFLRSEGAPASRGPRFKEAVNFAGALLGVDVREVTSSSRIQGAVNPGSSVSAVRKKAPLTVAQVRALEEFVCGADSDLSMVIGGFLLYLIHGRLRWSDAQHTEAEPQLDLVQGKGFLCAQLYHHKTANRGSLARHRLLPVACLTPGVGELNWGQAWLEARRRMQLRASRRLPLMPRPLIAGGFDTVPLDPSLGALWMREILKEGCPLDLGDFDWDSIATHSCKATVLSWMAKSAAPENLQAIAGYHMRGTNKSALEYSRDTLAPVLHYLEGLFLAIREGAFAPDATRAGRWMGNARSLEAALRNLSGQPEEGPEPLDDPPAGPQVREDPPSEPESAAPSLGSDLEAEEAVVSSFALSEDLVVEPGVRESLKCFRHRHSRVVHVAKGDNPPDEGELTQLRCGRFANRNYELLDETPAVLFQKCSSCWGGL